MKRKVVVSGFVAFVIGSMLAPPDRISELTLGIAAALLCVVPLWVLGRCGLMKTSSSSAHTLVCILVCLTAVLSVQCYTLGVRVRVDQQQIEELWDGLEAERDRADSNGASVAEG